MLSLRGEYYTGHPVDTPILTAAAVFGVAGLLRRSEATPRPRAPDAGRLSVPTAGVYLASLMMGPVALAINPAAREPLEDVVLLGGIGLVALLVLARLWGLMTEAEQAGAASLAASEALAASERRYRNVVEGVPGVVYRAEQGPRGRWVFVSPQIEKLTGHEPAEFMADAGLWLELVHSDDRDSVIAAEEEAARVKRDLDIVYRFVRSDGEERWVRVGPL